MEIAVYRTHEIDAERWELIANEFNTAFVSNKDAITLQEYYKKTRLGYSYHSLAFSDSGQLAGYNSLIPVLYKDNEGIDILVGISGGTFVVKEFRKDVFISLDMASALWKYISNENVVATLGVSNENSFQYALKFLDSTLISYLHYYSLPIRIFNVLRIKKLSSLNFITVLSSKLIVVLNTLISNIFNPAEKEVRFEINTDDQFFSARFGSDRYKQAIRDNLRAHYSVVSEEGIRTVYLMDFRQDGKRTYKSLVNAVKYILKNEKPDIILFIGHLRLRQFLLFRVPRRLEPQPLPLTFNISAKKYNSYFKAMSENNNWNFGLMNFDVR